MKTILYLIAGSCLLFTISCTKHLPFPDANADDVLVMNGLLSPESGVSVHLSQNCHITDTKCNQKNIDNAKVVLKDDSGNLLVELLYEAEGFYKADGFQIDHNKSFKIEASSSGFETIKSSTNTPKPFDCTLDTTSLDEKEINGYNCRTFKIQIQDNPDEENYYLIDGWVDILNGMHDEGIELESNGFIHPHTGFISSDVNVDNKGLVSSTDIIVYPLDFIFLRDENFNGQTYELEFGLFEEDINFDPNFELEAHITVKSASKELYNYFKSIAQYKLAAGALAEPSKIVDNIEEGIGIFGGYTEQEFIVRLPRSKWAMPQDFIITNNGCQAPCTIKIEQNGGSELNYFWEFGDGNSSTEVNPEHTFTAPGQYIVSLSISSPGDNWTIELPDPVIIN